jgi:hypothetical protein
MDLKQISDEIGKMLDEWYFEKKDKISSRKMCFHHIKEVKKLEIKKELDALNSYVEEVKFIL